MFTSLRTLTVTTLLTATAFTLPAYSAEKTTAAKDSPIATQRDVGGKMDMPTLKVHHYGLSVPSIDETSKWYQENLGFTVKQAKSDAPEVESKVALLEKNGFILELYEKEGSSKSDMRKPASIPEDLSVQGPKHIAFMTTDVDKLASILKEKNVKFLAEPTDLKATNLRVINIFDNNGNVIEIAQMLSAANPTKEMKR